VKANKIRFKSKALRESPDSRNWRRLSNYVLAPIVID
jgi:hypothetical protein